MAERATEFIITFNQIEKWLKDTANSPNNMGFVELVRRLGKRSDLPVKDYQDDLLQMAQLRNAIVHEKIADDFVIAEPNQWAVDRIQEIADHLLSPEKVYPKFKKRVSGFDRSVPLDHILKIVREKGYSQFPIYDHGVFEGLLTLHGLGLWFANESRLGPVKTQNRQIFEVLVSDRKKRNYYFLSSQAYVYQAADLFHQDPRLEALLITEDGTPDGNLVGIIRPKDLLKKE